MEVKIYVDVLFIINFIIDYILLCITSLFVKKTPIFFRMCSASVIGALYSVIVFFAPLNLFFSLFASFAVSFLMIAVSFGTKKASSPLKNIAVFYLVSASASGMAFAVIFSGKTHSAVLNNGIFYADIDAYTLLAIFALSVVLIHYTFGYIKKQKIKSCFLYRVTIEKNGNSISDVAFYDTGNFLSDPITQKSVLIAEWQTVSNLFAESRITEAIVNHPEDFVYIGCRSFGTSTGMYAFAPDMVTSDEIHLHEPILVAITESTLDKDGAFRMILPNTAIISTH